MSVHLSPVFVVAVPLALAAFTHLWNPVGFPALDRDEDVYMKRAMLVLKGLAIQDDIHFYYHPFFGQLFLAGILWAVGYPNSLDLSADGDPKSIEMIYLVPRLIMGSLAIVDTFLIYKICELRYSRKVAFFASIIFSVMPLTWFTRWILLDSIQLPFILASILFAIYTKKFSQPSGRDYNNKNNNIITNIITNKAVLLITLSGLFLGLAIFTKVHAFTMIPLIASIIYWNNNNNSKKTRLKNLGIWLVPVISVPLIWPGYAMSVGQFDLWLWGAFDYQLHRESAPLLQSLIAIFNIDPVLTTLGFAGLAFAAIRKDYFLLLWMGPFLIFLYFIGYVSPFHLISLLPAFCVSAALMTDFLIKKITRRNIQRILLVGIISGLGIFGLTSSIMLITTNLNSGWFEAIAFVTEHLPQEQEELKVPIIAVPIIAEEYAFAWIPEYIFNKYHDYSSYDNTAPAPAPDSKVVMIVNVPFMYYWSRTDSNKENVMDFQTIYNNTNLIAVFDSKWPNVYDSYKFPYISMDRNLGGKIEVRANEKASGIFSDIINNTQIIDLLGKRYTWSTVYSATLLQNQEGLTIKVRTNDDNEHLYNRGVLKTYIDRATTTELENQYPHLSPILLSLSLDYASQSLKGNATFYVEIRYDVSRINPQDGVADSVIWGSPLQNTGGKLITNQNFVLPNEILNKPIEFDFYVTTNGAGDHVLKLQKANILYREIK